MRIDRQKRLINFKLCLFLFYSLLSPNFVYSQSKEMIKLEWYQYILLSPILIIDAIERSYSEVSKGIQEYQENRNLPELHKAVIQGDLEKVKKLVTSGVNLEAKDKKGETALFYALDRNFANIARYLIQNKANVNVINIHGRHIIQPAIAKNQFDLVKIMIDHELNLQLKQEGDTVLTIACNLNPPNFKMVQLFVERGVNVNARDKNHYSALMYLTTKDDPNLDIIRYLIKNGADVNAKDHSGRSILRLLVERRSLNQTLVQTLLENGANINSRDKDGQAIFDYIKNYYDYPETDELVIYLNKHKKSNR